MRTSISCRSYKLTEPKKDLSKFHPRHSQHLRGSFVLVTPHSNITFDDIDNFYQKTLPMSNNNRKKTKPLQTPFATNVTFENIPYEYKNGLWHPVGVISVQRTAILIPLQGRDFNAKAFIFNIHAFARRQLLTYTVLLVEQVSPRSDRFNKGRLLNAGVRYIENQKSLNITCLILHDVDLIPENDGNYYVCEPSHPKHTTVRVRQIGSKRGYSRYYEFLIGGVLLLTPDMYRQVNGFSNLYWGWGGEDDDLSLRMIQRRVCVVRPVDAVAVYAALPHPHGHRNDARFNLLAWSTVRVDGDGYKQIDSLIEIVDVKQRSSVVHLKVNVDVEGSERRPSSLNESYERISARSETTTASRNKIVDVKQRSSVVHLKVNVDVEGSERRPSSLNESYERISARSETTTASRNST
ncbi:unnamed protein product [Adineta ricciae]|uniref:Beta-1,4-galactosyltransferase n=1 Tax=Adineta ricciae TaxID=249248 RepID=A0A815CNP9_ADIRI|nr:unnamed protein product [Adineta ricciae]